MSSDSAPSDRTASQAKEQPDAAGSSGEPPENEAPPGLERRNFLILSLSSFCLICFGVWLVSAGGRYREEYAQSMQGWRVGSTRQVELTVVKEDKRNLACASDQVIAGLRCGYRRDAQPAGPASTPSGALLQPYNTVGDELLLGANLWGSPELNGALPRTRFTVICSYQIKGVMKAVSVRFHPRAPFDPIGKTVTAGTLIDCFRPG